MKPMMVVGDRVFNESASIMFGDEYDVYRTGSALAGHRINADQLTVQDAADCRLSARERELIQRWVWDRVICRLRDPEQLRIGKTKLRQAGWLRES